MARQLIAAGYRVWFDEFELRVGDSLRARIDEGLSKSRFGVVILSRHFFAKKWPRAELDGLFARDAYDSSRLLPVWHGVAAEEIANESPLLAARVAAVADDVDKVAAQLIRAASRSGLAVPGEAVIELLETADSVAIAEWLLLNPLIVARALTAYRFLYVRPAIAECLDCSPDFLTTVFQPSIGSADIHAIMLGPVQPKETDQLAAVFAKAESFSRTAESDGYGRGDRRRSKPAFPGEETFVSGLVEVTVVAGRRPDSAQLQSKWLSKAMRGIELRTYDWLKDAAADKRMPREYLDQIEILGPGRPTSLSKLKVHDWSCE